MDFNALVEEIAARVAAKMEESACGAGCASADCDDGRPGLLVLTQEHGTVCHQMLESQRLQECYRTDCALVKEYQCDITDYEAVILFDLTIDAMTRLAGGICDTPFTALAQKAILCGKKIFVPQEAVELFRYVETVPSAYYQMLLDKLTLLKQSGMVVCPAAALEDAILSGETESAAPAEAPAAPAPSVMETPMAAPVPTGAGKEASISKRVITERDIAAVYDRTVTSVHVGARSIVTDLAREYAAARGVSIIKDS